MLARGNPIDNCGAGFERQFLVKNLKNEDESYCSTDIFNLYTFSLEMEKKNFEKNKKYLGICRGGGK